MKKWMTLITVTALSFASMNALAKTKKNEPDRKEVEKILKDIGGDHYVERMKISSLCSMEMEDAAGEDIYYHIFNVTLKKGGYRIVFFDNTPTYLGFYKTEFEAYDYEQGAIFLDSGESDEDGNDLPYKVTVSAKGPSAKIRIDGVPSAFIKNPKLDEKKGGAVIGGGGTLTVPQPKSADGKTIEYRDWEITIKGQKIEANAIFVEKVGSSIKIKDSKRGKTATIPLSALSAKDRDYLKGIGEL